MNENIDVGVTRELKGIESDKAIYSEQIYSFQNNLARELKGDMGKDIKDVLSGKKVISISKKEKFSFKVKCFFNKLFSKL